MTKLIRPGDRSAEVTDVQVRLRALGFELSDENGYFGPATERALRTFQQQRSLLVDGIVGAQTWNELVGASWRLGDRILYLKAPPMRGDDVSQLQRKLNAMGFDAGREDAIFGTNTDTAVRAFQKEYGVAEDGIFGYTSQAALLGLRIDRPGLARSLREQLDRLSHAGIGGAIVVIDPGHGGQDPGERADGGALTEAAVCWQLASGLAENLERAGAKVELTRGENEDVDASERARRANEANADLFVSIHLNSNPQRNASGTSTFFFGGSSGGEALADDIQEQLVGLGLNDCRSHARSFSLLKETRMPAVLVEPVFITNPEEEVLLTDPEFRSRLAEAMAVGVLTYFEKET
ncbi:MAG: N-acetylmuramoyl-L-alanine amidase [Actinomycetota bacterium]